MTIDPDPSAVQGALAPILGYHLAIDQGRATSAAELFTDDADLEMRGERLRGREEILRFLTDRQAQVGRQTVHVLVNTRSAVHHVDGPADWRGAVVNSLILLYVRQPDGRYELSRVLDAEHEVQDRGAGWRVHRRSAGPLHPSLEMAVGPTEPTRI